jgi:hypothetical protein
MACAADKLVPCLHPLAGIYRQAQAGTLLVPTSPPTPKGESSDLGFFISNMAKPPFIGPLVKCQAEGCERISRYVSVHLCGKHEMRLHRYGDTSYVTSKDQFRKKCSDAQRSNAIAQPHVYRKLNGRHEHRVVAEQMLGRPLNRGEIVHHIDGNKHNNTPENLQVMTQSEHIRAHHAEMVKARKAAGGYIRKSNHGN